MFKLAGKGGVKYGVNVYTICAFIHTHRINRIHTSYRVRYTHVFVCLSTIRNQNFIDHHGKKQISQTFCHLC